MPTIGRKIAASNREPNRSTLPLMSQWTGTRSGSDRYATTLMTIASRRMSGAYHLRTFPPSSGRWACPLHDLLEDIVEHGGVELVDDLLAVALGENEPGVAEHAEVARHGRPRGWEMLCDLARGARSVAEQLEDVASGRVSDCAKNVFHAER